MKPLSAISQDSAQMRLIEALADRLVRDHLMSNSASERDKPDARPNHVDVAQPAKAA